MKIRVIKASKDSYWYADRIGDVFTVNAVWESCDDGSQSFGIEEDYGYIEINDCEILTEGDEEMSIYNFGDKNKRAVLEVKANEIPEEHSMLELFISNKYEYDPLDSTDNFYGYYRDKKKPSTTKHLKDGYEYLVHIEGEFKNPMNIVVRLSESDKSYWESH